MRGIVWVDGGNKGTEQEKMMRTINKIEASLRRNGWTGDDVGRRAKIIFCGERSGERNATGLRNGDYIAVEFSSSGSHPMRPAVGMVISGRLTVGGCYPSPGMVGRRLSRPWRLLGGDNSTIGVGGIRAILGDGTEVLMGEQLQGMYSYVAAGQNFDCVMDAAIALTPESGVLSTSGTERTR